MCSKERERKKEQEHLYFREIYTINEVKIGYSRHVEHRLEIERERENKHTPIRQSYDIKLISLHK